MPMLRLALALTLLAPVAAAQEISDFQTSPESPEATSESDDLAQLVEWMTGSFSSAAQAAADPAFLDIRLHMAPIWTDRMDGQWLYVEQATAEEPDRPYRQRVYRVTEPAPGLFQIEVFAIPSPERFVGAWGRDAPLAEIGPEDLIPRHGCETLLRRRGDRFLGSTLDALCQSQERGADHATSEVEITRWGLVAWDRGWTSDGVQVWGSVSGGYVFEADSADAESAVNEKQGEGTREVEQEGGTEDTSPPPGG